MSSNLDFIIRHIAEIIPKSTSHGVGLKRVLVSKAEIGLPITQIAYTELHKGDYIEGHSHSSMDEHFYFVKGVCEVQIGEKRISCIDNDYMFIPSGMMHSIIVSADTELITIGVAHE